ncbi:hypothetical protein F4560_005389 [Saccharothrix ecbatanensis]|uniref:DUF3105 domain-containing protein n=1 Tax=Saccharothrix ecbatanensis TaxID=1105145 RepID=A0A7W9HP09_9PSEU|nr:DUF3105 domain-containing protein [Saccharothrix ecbatanensis]MBB5805621.1 hypothetical protein [Saccharothrix ecbatanensis]
MTSGKKTKAARGSVAAARSSVVAKKPKPWGTILAVVAVLALAGTVFGYAFAQISEQNAKEAALAKWVPSEENKDPSDQITGVVKRDYKPGKHIDAPQRVAYDFSPPFGGPHDNAWADCNGVVYPTAVRTENVVHALEHGSVWVAYNPDQVTGEALDKLKARVDGQPFTIMSPYPGLDKPIALQSWGHQLKLESVDDERIDQFVKALRRNQYTYPEVGAPCDNPTFASSPAPFAPEPPGADAEPMGDEAESARGAASTAPSSAATPSGS